MLMLGNPDFEHSIVHVAYNFSVFLYLHFQNLCRHIKIQEKEAKPRRFQLTASALLLQAEMSKV